MDGQVVESDIEAYRNTLSDLVQNSEHRNVYFVDGREAMPVTGLSTDLIHPTNAGMIQFGNHLATALLQAQGSE